MPQFTSKEMAIISQIQLDIVGAFPEYTNKSSLQNHAWVYAVGMYLGTHIPFWVPIRMPWYQVARERVESSIFQLMAQKNVDHLTLFDNWNTK